MLAGLEVAGLCKRFGGIVVADAIDLTVPAGRIVGLIGHNGAGKTTLLRCIVGAHVPHAGVVRFQNKPVAAGHIAENVRNGIAFVGQGHNVFPILSVERNLRIAGLLFDQTFAKEVLRIFPVLEERRHQRAGSMSGGEQQMLALGMALMTRPKWLLLDEPSTGLAPVIVRNVMRQLREINETFGTGLMIVEQNVPVTLKIVERAIILKSAAVVFDGSAETLASKPDLWEWF